ncbi:unnamed protein product [Lathyrus oleraceus]
MAKIVKFVYVIINILSLFLAATNVESWYPSRRCFRDYECHKNRCREPKIAKCVGGWCNCVKDKNFIPS